MVSKFVDWRNTILNLRELRMGSTKITATPDEINQVCDGVGPTATAANLTALTDEKVAILAAASGGGSGRLIAAASPGPITLAANSEHLFTFEAGSVTAAGFTASGSPLATFTCTQAGRYLLTAVLALPAPPSVPIGLDLYTEPRRFGTTLNLQVLPASMCDDDSSTQRLQWVGWDDLQVGDAFDFRVWNNDAAVDLTNVGFTARIAQVG
jgi:hypothetical protein